MSNHVFSRIASIAAALLAVLAIPCAFAVTFTVNNILDQPDDLTVPGSCHTAAGTCTLRAAVMQANRASADVVIVVPAGIYVLTIAPAGSDGEDSGDLDITSGTPVISINGAGQGATIVDANYIDRVFHVHAGRSAHIAGLTIRNGFTASDGGGVYNQGTLTISDATVTNSYCANFGGGIYNGDSQLTILNTTISHNTSLTAAGGLYNNFGTVTVTSSTVGQNIAQHEGGGIANVLGPMRVVTSTIFGNAAGTDGGGIWNSAGLDVVDSTLSQNNANTNGGGIYNFSIGVANLYSTSILFNGADADADVSGGSGGGIFNDFGIVNLRNSLVAGNNIQDAPAYDDCTGTLNSYGRNLFWNVVVCTIIDGPGGSWTTLNALNTIGPLQSNGGPTWTHALLPASNAIDGGDPVSGCIDNVGTLTTDQRGAPRVAGVRCDIGAFEYAAATTPALQGAVSRKVHGAAGTYNLPLSSIATNPTTEPRLGPAQTIVFNFDKPITGATAAITEGAAMAGAPTFSGSDVIVGLTGVTNQQYVTITLTNVASSDGGSGGVGSVRVGFLAGDVNQSRVVTVADLGLVNAQLAQAVNATNYLKDVNATGTLTVADKGIANANLAKALPPP